MAATGGLAVSWVGMDAGLTEGAFGYVQSEDDHACSGIPENAMGPEIPEKGYLVEEIRDGLYWVTDGTYQVMFLVSCAGVVVVDAPPALGENIQKAVAEVTEESITHVVYSHSHIDHIGAAHLYPDDAEIVASAWTARLLEGYGDPNRPVPTTTFEERYTLEVGDQTFQLDYHGPNHSLGNTFVYAPHQKVLMLVDVVYPGWVPFYGLAMYVPGFVDAHDRALEYDFETFVGGHLTRLGTREDVETQREYVLDLYEAVGEAAQTVSFADAAAEAGADPANRWAGIRAYYDAIAETAAEPVVEAWCDRLGGVEAFAPSHALAVFRSTSVDTGAP